MARTSRVRGWLESEGDFFQFAESFTSRNGKCIFRAISGQNSRSTSKPMSVPMFNAMFSAAGPTPRLIARVIRIAQHHCARRPEPLREIEHVAAIFFVRDHRVSQRVNQPLLSSAFRQPVVARVF